LTILGHGRRKLIHHAVTAHPTAKWIAQQIVEAFPWDETPRHLVRDRDAVYGQVVKRRLRGLGIRDSDFGQPWATISYRNENAIRFTLGADQ
jgi:hypothetical protein